MNSVPLQAELSFWEKRPCHLLKLYKKWVWNTFESIVIRFYKYFIIMQCSLSEKRPQQIYITLCSNLHTVLELYHTTKSLTFFPGNFFQVFWASAEALRWNFSPQIEKTWKKWTGKKVRLFVAWYNSGIVWKLLHNVISICCGHFWLKELCIIMKCV